MSLFDGKTYLFMCKDCSDVRTVFSIILMDLTPPKLLCLSVHPVRNATKLISLDSVGATESSGIHFVAFQTGRIFKIKIKPNLKIAQNRRSGALLMHGPVF